jgi:integrase
LKRNALAAKERQAAAEIAKAEAATAQALTVGAIWPRYLAEGRPKRKDAWKPGYRASLDVMAAPGGVPKKRGKGMTRPGPLHPLLSLALVEVTEDALQEWFEREAKAGRHQATRALMMFRGFLRWCAARPEFRQLVNRDAGKAPAILENLPANTKRTDAIEAAQLPGWWQGVGQLRNRTASIYLKALLLTGARKEELAGLMWNRVDFQWRKLTIADKVAHTRTIPLSPYLAQQLMTLKRTNGFVFASAGKAGRIADSRASHAKALLSAGIDGLTIHGLRRSFSLLGEAAGAPAGAIAQVMGHAPSATAEGYRPRSLDALRPYLERIEAHILEQAGIVFDAKAEPGKLRVVAGA